VAAIVSPGSFHKSEHIFLPQISYLFHGTSSSAATRNHERPCQGPWACCYSQNSRAEVPGSHRRRENLYMCSPFYHPCISKSKSCHIIIVFV